MITAYASPLQRHMCYGPSPMFVQAMALLHNGWYLLLFSAASNANRMITLLVDPQEAIQICSLM